LGLGNWCVFLQKEYLSVDTYLHIPIRRHIYIYICVCVYIIYIYICIFIYIYYIHLCLYIYCIYIYREKPAWRSPGRHLKGSTMIQSLSGLQ
jgi:heme/copper-type cytochrome/quinol oxidase subunit 2